MKFVFKNIYLKTYLTNFLKDKLYIFYIFRLYFVINQDIV